MNGSRYDNIKFINKYKNNLILILTFGTLDIGKKCCL